MRYVLNTQLFKDINRRFFWTATVLIGCLCVVSFFAQFAREEGTLGNSFISNLLADTFTVLRFPFHPMLWLIMDFLDEVVRPVSALLYFIGLFGNCLFYAFILERGYHLTVDLRREKADQH